MWNNDTAGAVTPSAAASKLLLVKAARSKLLMAVAVKTGNFDRSLAGPPHIRHILTEGSFDRSLERHTVPAVDTVECSGLIL